MHVAFGRGAENSSSDASHGRFFVYVFVEQGEEKHDETAVAVPGAADEENGTDEFECISGLLDELGDQMGR